MKPRLLVLLAIIILAIGTIVVYFVNRYVQVTLPFGTKADILLVVAILIGVASFLAAFKDILELVDKLFSKKTQAIPKEIRESVEKEESNTAIDTALSVRSSTQFIGRYEELETIMSAMRDPNKKIIAIYGLGGIGKTALALEIVSRCSKEKQFFNIVWINIKVKQFEGGTIKDVPERSFTKTNDILDEIGRSLGDISILRLNNKDKKKKLAEILMSKKILIVLDNLDTANDPQDLIATLQSIVGQCKILITSRHQFDFDTVYNYVLSGMNISDGINFINQEASNRGIKALLNTTQDTLQAIFNVTGGAPLAMRLVIGQMLWQPIQSVLNSLLEAKFDGQDYPFYRFVYQRSWDLLPDEAKRILVSMAVFAPGLGGSESAVLATSRESPDKFHRGIETLVKLSLVDLVGYNSNQRYSLHSLTYYFILSDVVKRWG